MTLKNNKCTPCGCVDAAMDADKAIMELSKLSKGWRINNKGRLYKAFSFKDFAQAMNFANLIATIAEEECHHPNLTIAWGKCDVETWTHSVNGLTDRDYSLANKIDKLQSKRRQ